MASARHWSEAVYLSPKRIQVSSVVTIGDPENDNHSELVESSSGGQNSASLNSVSQDTLSQQEGQNNNKTNEQNYTTELETKETETFLTRILCCARKPGENGQETQANPTGNMFVVSQQSGRSNIEDESQDQNDLELVSVAEENPAAEQNNRPSDEEKIPEYLHYMLKVSYNLGLSTYNPSCDQSQPTSWTAYLLRLIQKFAYWMIAFMAFLHSFYLIKINWFTFVKFGGIINFVDVGFRLVPILTELYVAQLFAFQHAKIKKMLADLTELAAFGQTAESTTTSESSQTKQKKAFRIIKALVFVSLLVCIVQLKGKSNSVEAKLLFNSQRISYFAFIWTTDDYYNKNVTGELHEEYGTTITATTIALGLTRSIMEFCNNFKMEIIINLIIITGWCLKEHLSAHARKVQNIDFATYTNGNDYAAFISTTGDWAKYQRLKKANKAINAVFDVLLRFMHIHTVSLVAYFLMHLLDNEFNSMRFVVILYNIAKLTFAYYVAKKSHGYNTVFQKWITDWALHSTDVQFQLKVPAILEEMKREPLGLGTGDFIIGETFILKLIAYAGSLFMLQVDKSE